MSRGSLGVCNLVSLGKIGHHAEDTALLHHHLLVLSEEWLKALRGVLVGATILCRELRVNNKAVQDGSGREAEQ